MPAYTIAAFCKRLARLSLTAPPSGAMIAISFIYNLVRRHPACSALLHNPIKHKAAPAGAEQALLFDGPQQQADASQAYGQDVFDEFEVRNVPIRCVWGCRCCAQCWYFCFCCIGAVTFK